MKRYMPFMLASTLLAPAVGSSNDVQPKEAKTLSAIVQGLEEKGIGPFVEASYDDGLIEVEAYRDDESLELTVDPATGDVLSEHRDEPEPRPPQGSLKFSEILSRMEDSGHVRVNEASFERRYWEVETIRDNTKYESHVDPKSGDVISERVDD